MERHCLPVRLVVRRLKRSGYWFSSVTVALKPIDGNTGQWRYLSSLSTADRAVRSAARQRAQTEQPDDAKPKFFQAMFGLVVLKPLSLLRDYVHLLALASEYEILALKIRTDRLNASDLAKAAVLSAAVAAIIAQGLDVDTGDIRVGFGLLDSMLNGLLLMFIYLLAAAIIHWPLRLAGGKASFRNTFTANAFISAASYPLLVLIAGIGKY